VRINDVEIAGWTGVYEWGRCKHILVALNENVPVFRNPIHTHLSTPAISTSFILTGVVQNQEQEKNQKTRNSTHEE